MKTLKQIIGGFEGNEQAQFRFHMTMTAVWLLCMLGVPFVPGLYGHSVAALIIIEISLYANAATEYGSATTQGAVIRRKNNG